MTLRQISLISTVFFAINTILPCTVLAQDSQDFQAADLTQEIGPGNFGISHIPQGFNFDALNITSPGTKHRYYIATPGTNNNYIEIYDGRYDGGFKLTVQATNYSSGTHSLGVTQESFITSNFSATQEIKDDTDPVSETNLLYHNMSDPDENTSFQNFPPNGILVILDAPTASSSQGRVGTYRLYPSFKLDVPDTTPAGTYSNTITYTIEDSVN